jgi:GDP-4-dehydro-6-deoxy-D-mannose reductase
MNDGPVLVTGASGFVGRHLLEQLRSTHDVVGWSRSPVATELAGVASWQQVDVTKREQVRSALRELRPRQIYHFAGATQVDRSWTMPAEALETNVLATHHLLDALGRTGVAARVLISGSATVYAPSTVPLAETSPAVPRNPYGLSKLAQEMLSVRAAAEDGIDVVITRSFNHTGPGQPESFVAPSIARQIARIERGLQEPVLKVGNLDALRDLTDVRDVVRAYTGLMTSGVTGEIYNVASGVGRSIRSILDTLVAAATVPVRVEVEPARVRKIDTSALIGDASKLRALTGWTPLIPFEQTVTDLLTYWRAHTVAT